MISQKVSAKIGRVNQLMLLRPKKKNCLFPVTVPKKIG